MNWSSWISLHWSALVQGFKIDAPRALAPLAKAGFRATALASPEGQVADWALSMTDGSRIHVHVYRDGRRVVHRDKYDPARGIGAMIAHLAADTPLGFLALVGGTVWLASSTSEG